MTDRDRWQGCAGPDRPALAVELVAKYGTISGAAEAVGLGRNAFRDQYRAGEGAHNPPPISHQVPTMTPLERQDAAFWRNKAAAAAKECSRLERLAAELSGARAVDPAPPEWHVTPGDHGGRRSVIVCHVSDMHMGEVIRPGEIQGINAFDPDICRDRMQRYFQAACEIGPRWSTGTRCEGALLTLGGDLISGDIHEELLRTNALGSLEQVRAAVEVVLAGVRLLVETFGRVHVASVPGNHGRTTHKPTAKLYSALSYDTMIAGMARDMMGDPRVTWQVDGNTDQIIPVLGRTVFLTHGDKIGTGGGQGFAGPMLPIIRGAQKVRAQQASIGREPDYILVGHYHTSGNPGRVLANGSVPGYSEYGNGLRAAVEPPQQWLAMIDSVWGMRERLPVQLERPSVPELPRVRVPVAMAAGAA